VSGNSGDRLYIYGVIPTGEEINFGTPGIDDPSDQVYTIPYQDIAAVVSACPAKDYASMTREMLIGELVQHQQVVEQTMSRFAVLPVKFGTTVEDRAHATLLLQRGYSEFKAAHSQMHDKIQVEIIATWDLQSVLGEVAQEATISELKAKIGTDSSPSSIPDRIRLGEAIKSALDRQRERYQQEALSFLADCAADLRSNPLFDDGLVLNVAVLLPKERLSELDERLDELDRKTDGQLTFRRVGPLPPYSFSTVDIKRIGPEEVQQARERLDLPQQASLAEVKQAYYRQARKYHPDAQADGAADDDQFAQVQEASRLLVSYCRAQLDAREPACEGSDDEVRCSFEVGAADGAILISVGSSGGDVP
jgi:hypothetical protein